ncbi:MAG: hypothetical protein GY754_38080, partial [bacterium]|nr:hypothetical protein [bacterium]
LGADVTLLMGPGRARLAEPTERFNIIKFKYYEEILSLVKEHVGAKKHEIMIHSAAVADYTPVETGAGKIKSGKDELVITLKPTIKIVDLIKEIDPSLFLVKFKLEVDLPEEKLIDIAYNSMLHSKADLIVANDFTTVSNNHKAFIIDPEKNIESFTEKEVIALNVLKTIAARV